MTEVAAGNPLFPTAATFEVWVGTGEFPNTTYRQVRAYHSEQLAILFAEGWNSQDETDGEAMVVGPDGNIVWQEPGEE